MTSFTRILVLLTAIVAAAANPTTLHKRDSSVQLTKGVALVANACDIAACIKSLAGLPDAIESCVEAFSEDGLNPIFDGECFLAAADAGTSIPKDCGGCL